MKVLQSARGFVTIAFISFCLGFLTFTSAQGQAIDRSVTKTGPATATFNTPFTYTITLALPAGTNPSFVLTDTLPGGIRFEVFECPNPPCPPNNVGDIVNLSESPITGVIAVGGSQMISISFLSQGQVITSVVPLTYTLLVRAIPTFSTPGVITNTVTLPPDGNPVNNLAMVVQAVNEQQPPPVYGPVPTLRDWGMITMIILLGSVALYSMWRRKTAMVIRK